MTEPAHVVETRRAYDTVAADYAKLLRDELARMPHDRAVLRLFADLVAADGGGPVVDVGCGPGRITGHLAGLGADVSGIDLSPAMVDVARSLHPAIRFDVGSVHALPLADGTLAGVVAWYSLIHTPPGELPGVLAEIRRVLRPGGHLVVAFKVGDRRVRREQAYGHDVGYDVYWLPPERLAGMLIDAGFDVETRVVRAPERGELQPQGYLLARRGTEVSPTTRA